MKKLFALSLLIGHSFLSLSQDFVFTQFSLTPINLSPTAAGLSGTDQLAINYRHQPQSFGLTGKTISLNYDRPFKLKNGFLLGVGLKYSNEKDRFVPHEDFWNSQQYSIAGALHVPIMQKGQRAQKLIFGLEGGQTMIDWAKFRRHGAGTNGVEESINFSGGVTYRVESKANQYLDMGLSILQMNSFSSNRTESFLSPRKVFYFTGQIALKENWWINPKFVYTRNEIYDLIIFGAGIKHKVAKHQFETHIGLRQSTREEFFGFIGPRYFYKSQIGFSTTFEVGRFRKGYEGTILYKFPKKANPKIEKVE